MTINYNTEIPQLTDLERMRHFREQANKRFGFAKFLAYAIEHVASGEVALHYEPLSEHMRYSPAWSSEEGAR